MVEYSPEKRQYRLNTEILKDVCSLTFMDEKVGDSTLVGYLKGFWDNEFEKELPGALPIPELLKKLEKEVDRIFGE